MRADHELPSVLLVAPVPPPYGGMSVQGQLLLGRLRDSGVDVRLLPTNVGVGVFGRIPLLRTLIGIPVFLGRLLWALRGRRVVHLLAASGSYWWLRSAPTILVARLFGRRVLANYRGGLAESFFARHRRSALPILRRAHVLTVPSGFLERVFREFGEAPVVVPNVTDLDRLPFHEGRTPGQRLLVARNLEPIYNVGLAIAAFGELAGEDEGVRLTIAGEGSERAALEILAAATGHADRIAFVGRVDNADMPQLYERHDTVLNPTDVDNMPISLLEAMACGLTVVSTDVGGVPDLVRHEEHALLVPPRDPAAMAAAVRRLRGEPATAAALVRAGRAHAESFRWSAVRERLFEVYRGLVSGDGADRD